MSFWKLFWSRYRAPVVLLALVVFCAVAFRDVLLPFMVALFVAYLIEPVVTWLAARSIRGRPIPRGGAVIFVYSVVLAVLSLFVVVVGPQLAREVGGLARDVPTMIQSAREEHLPHLNERLERFIARAPSSPFAVERARVLLEDAVEKAEQRSFLVGAAPTYEERERLRQGLVSVSSQVDERAPDRALVRLRPDDDGAWTVLLAHDDLRIDAVGEGRYRVRLLDDHEDVVRKPARFDLTRVLDDSLDTLANASGQKFSEALAIGQRLVSKLTGAMLSTLVTFMVAAFISIDVPNILAFFRSLFPPNDQRAVGELLRSLNRGLSGVIRGQLVICVVNGVLTWIGLFALGVKFSFVLAVIAGLLSLIPVFGTIVSTVPCVLIASTQSLTTGLFVLLWILFIHFIEGNILNPKIIGSAAKIHPALIVFALLAGEHTYGILGALLAVPVASIVQTLFLFFKENRWADLKMGDVLGPEDVSG